MKYKVSPYAVLTLLVCLIMFVAKSVVLALHNHEGGDMGAQHTGDFRASTAQPFAELMDEAMAIMHQGMDQAPKTGNSDHDFAAMMIPHHQGAVDMAKVELVYGKDPVLRRLAQEIIVTQGQEIEVMRMRLKQHHVP
jgi:uncharacterized protein (DUF305 family)